MVFRCLSSAILMAGLLFTSMSSAQTKEVVLNEKNVIVLRGEVTSDSVGKVVQQLYATDQERVYLFLSSPGGSITAGNTLVSAIKGAKSNVSCVASVAASMAFVILQACDQRFVLDNSIVMQHVASYGLEGEEPNNASFNDFIERMLLSLKEMQSTRIGITVDEFKKKVRDDWWLYGAESVTSKVADEVVNIRCTPELTKLTYKQVLRTFFGNISLEWNSCPMIEYPVKIDFEQSYTLSLGEANQELNKFLEKFKARDYILKYRGTDRNKRPRLVLP